MAGLARTLSKLGYCSRRLAGEMIVAGRVLVNGQVRRNPELPIRLPHDQITIDGQPLVIPKRVYLMLNKPRGLVTTAADEQGRSTVFECFQGQFQHLHLSAVGRLDKASEGLLLFTNDTQWAEAITSPATHLLKTYHVKVNRLLDDDELVQLAKPVADQGEILRVRSVERLRAGTKTCWLQFELDEGRNRHLRRLCKAHQLEVLRLVRVKIGPLSLAEMSKSSWRYLTNEEVKAVAISAGLAKHRSVHIR